ncbi:MAG: hypothetical protein WC965_01870 [Thiohalomonadaceae bacterium]
MQTISLPAIENIESLSPFTVVSGDDVVVFSVSEDVVTYLGSSGSSVFSPDFLNRQLHTSTVDESFVFFAKRHGETPVSFVDERLVYPLTLLPGSGAFLFAPMLTGEASVSTRSRPVLGTGLPVSTTISSGFMVYGISSSRTTEVPAYDSEIVMSPAVVSTATINVTPPLSSEFLVLPTSVSDRAYLSTSRVLSEFFVYPVKFSSVKSLPLLLKAATVTGDMSPADISSYQSYYSVSSVPDPSLLRVAKVTAGGIPYIESKNALSSGVMYSAFYIVNNTSIPNLVRRNIYLSMSGGIGYRAVTSSVPNGITIYEGSQFTTNDDILLGASSRTSLFDQVRISLLLSPSGELYPFNPDGSSAYFDLRNRAFSPANSRLRVPDLAPGDYYGVYMKVETAFSPDDIKTKDYSFVNLSYINDYGSYKTRESYPGQVETITGVKTSSTLPSIYFEFYSEYQSMVTEISASVERLYSKYPPYFLHYEDLDE